MKHHQFAHPLVVVSAHIGLGVFALLLWASIAAPSLVLGATSYIVCGTIAPSEMNHEIDNAYQSVYFVGKGDSGQAPATSTLMVFENGTAMGPAHSAHADIRTSGAGRFSHWGSGLYFSSSDNSSPITNGRAYTWGVPEGELCPIPVPNGKDQTAALQQWVNATPNGSVLEFPANATYIINSKLLFVDRSNLTFEGSSTTLKTTVARSNVSFIEFYKGANIIMRNLVIDGGRQSGTYESAHEFEFGVGARGISGLELDSMQIQNVGGDCVYVDAYSTSGPQSSNVSVYDSTCTNAGRMGVAVTGASSTTVLRNTFTNIAIHVIDCEPDYPQFGCQGIKVDSNNVLSYGQGSSFSPWFFVAGVPSNIMSDIVVTNNTVHGLSPYLVLVHGTSTNGSRWRNVTITGNVADAAGSQVVVRHADNVMIDNNTNTTVTTEDVTIAPPPFPSTVGAKIIDEGGNCSGYSWRIKTSGGWIGIKETTPCSTIDFSQPNKEVYLQAVLTRAQTTGNWQALSSATGAQYTTTSVAGDCNVVNATVTDSWLNKTYVFKINNSCSTINYSGSTVGLNIVNYFLSIGVQLKDNTGGYVNENTAAPTCTVSYAPSSASVGQSYTISLTSQNATSRTYSVTNSSGAYVVQNASAAVGTSTYTDATSSQANPAGTYTRVDTVVGAGGSGACSASFTITALAKPTISSFTASSTTVTAGQSSLLSWVTSLATFLSIDQGVGTVTGTSKSVVPTATTTYTLSAGNAAGTTTASVTVNVKPVVAVSDPMVQICSSGTCASTVGAKIIDEGGNCSGYSWRIKTSGGWIGIKETTPCSTIDFSQPDKQLYLKAVLTRAQTTGNWQALSSATGAQYTATSVAGDCNVVNATVTDSWLNKTYVFKINNSCSTINYSGSTVGLNIVNYFLSIGVQLKDNTGGYVNTN